VSGGLLFAVTFAGFIYPRLAPWLAGGFVASLIVSERLFDARLISPAELYLVDLGFVALCWLVGNTSRDRRPTEGAQQWLAGVRRERPPAATGLPYPGRGWRLAARLLWVVAAACLVWGWYVQQAAGARERAAERATADVIAHLDEFTVETRLAGQTTPVSVYDAAQYPVGSRMELYVDDRGLHQPVSEPYDASGWLLLGVFLAAIGWLGWARGVEKGNGPRLLFDEEQPVTEVAVLPGVDRFAVYAGDARPGEPAIVEIVTRPISVEEDEHGNLGSPRSLLEPRLHPASLYGVPAPGHWCAIVVNGEVVAPTRPISARKVGAPPYRMDIDGDDEDDAPTTSPISPAPDLPLRPEEVEALHASDQDRSPERVRFHTRSPLIGYLNALLLPVTIFPIARFLPDLSLGVRALLAAAVVAASCAVGWRVFMRGRVAWNGRGIAVVGAFGYKRVPWRMVTGIEHDRHHVTVHTGYSSLAVGAGSVLGFIGRRDRTVEQLANALRHTRNAAQVSPDETARWSAAVETPVAAAPLRDLPNLEAPRPPAGLYLLWLVLTPAVAWLLAAVPG
jgi:hypothetical protein